MKLITGTIEITPQELFEILEKHTPGIIGDNTPDKIVLSSITHSMGQAIRLCWKVQDGK